MSPASDFDDAYQRLREPLLVQVYAYCGDADAAVDALDEAFIDASRHWHRVGRLPAPQAWVRDRAIRFLEGRPRRVSTGPEPVEWGSNTHLLRCLATLTPTSRRLLLVRRLGGSDLPSAAREVGLTDAAAEQVLARASTALHGAGIDTTPAGLRERLAALGDDLRDREPTPARALRRSGTRRRYALTGLTTALVVAVAAAAGALTASHPTAELAATAPSPSTSHPTTTPTAPPVHLSSAQLLTAEQVAAAAGTPWTTADGVATPPNASVFGACVPASLNPPPSSTWTRRFVPGHGGKGSIRQVVQLAPTTAEAQRAFRQVVNALGECVGQQLATFDVLHHVGERSRVIGLRAPTSRGVVTSAAVVSQSGPVVSVLTTVSAPSATSPLADAALVRLARVAATDICPASRGACASGPSRRTAIAPPIQRVLGPYLSPVDLPLVGHLTAPWTATALTHPATNPSATACDQTDFRAAGARSVTARAYVMPAAKSLPALFGLTETIAQFPDAGQARRLVRTVAAHVAGCHKRQLSLTVAHSTPLHARSASGYVWEVVQHASRQTTTTLRIALVRAGRRVAEVTFTPGAPAFDVDQTGYAVLAARAGLRLGATP